MYKQGISRDEAQGKLFKEIGDRGEKILRNANGEGDARLSKSSVGKLMSNTAVHKSMGNGFTKEQHYAVVSDIDNLYRNAVKIWSHPDRHGNAEVTIHRLATPLHLENGAAYITVKESTLHGRRVHTAELIEIGKLGGILEEARKNSTLTSPAPSFYDDNIRNLLGNTNNEPATINVRHSGNKVNTQGKKISATPKTGVIPTAQRAGLKPAPVRNYRCRQFNPLPHNNPRRPIPRTAGRPRTTYAPRGRLRHQSTHSAHPAKKMCQHYAQHTCSLLLPVLLWLGAALYRCLASMAF